MMKCDKCNGEGCVRGGFLYRKCDTCHGKGNIEVKTEPKKNIVIDRRSKLYKEALKEIMSSDEKLSKKEASDILDRQLKLDDTIDVEC